MIIDSYCYTKVWKVKPGYLQMTLFPRLGVAGISTPWRPFRYPQPVKMSISIASSPRLSGTGMTSLNPWFLPLNCQMIAYLSSPLLWELGPNFPQSQPLVKVCQFGVSPVNYSDSEVNSVLDKSCFTDLTDNEIMQIVLEVLVDQHHGKVQLNHLGSLEFHCRRLLHNLLGIRYCILQTIKKQR